MNEPIKRPDSYKPAEKPEIISAVEEKFPGFQMYKNILYQLEYLKFGDSFKFLALPGKDLKPFENIGMFKDKYLPKLPNTTGKNIGVGMYTNLIGDKFDYYFGQRVTSLGEIPDGLVGIDTHTECFCVMIFIANSMYELVGDEKGPGDAMQTAGEYIKNEWLPEHKSIAVTDENGECGKVAVGGKLYHTGNFEVYSEEHTAGGTPAMSFYIPLKNDSL